MSWYTYEDKAGAWVLFSLRFLLMVKKQSLYFKGVIWVISFHRHIRKDIIFQYRMLKISGQDISPNPRQEHAFPTRPLLLSNRIR